MDIETMKTFLVLVDTKNFTRTAHQLFIAQSTVTNRILELEKELNVTLKEHCPVMTAPDGTTEKCMWQ